MMELADTITAGVAATKRRLLAGGLLQLVSWGVPVGERDERGRITYAYSDLDAFIEQRPEIDRGRFSTERSDDTMLYVFDPVVITDAHIFRFGDPVHTYKIKKIDGILQDADGTRYFSEVSIIR